MKFTTKIISIFLILTFGALSVCPPEVSAQNVLFTGDSPLLITSASAESLPIFKGIKIFPQEPFRFDFIVDGADAPSDDPERAVGAEGSLQSDSSLRSESMRLVKYFMAALTVPEGDLWVNLSPYEPDRIVPQALGETEMGRDLLAQDYILKQLTASLMSPEGEAGKKFWEKIYSAAETTYIPIETFNKVWIIPDQVEVYQNGDVAYIVNARLKVMLEEDYYAAQQSELSSRRTPGPSVFQKTAKDAGSSTKAFEDDSFVKSIIKETVIPIIEDEVNNGASFANLRQIFHSMILAKWYEQHFKNSVLGQNYVDHNTTSGIQLEDLTAKQKIYEQYVQAFKSGAADVIKEDYDPVTQEVVTRKYFTGGYRFVLENNAAFIETRKNLFDLASLSSQPLPLVSVHLHTDEAMMNSDEILDQESEKQQFYKIQRSWAYFYPLIVLGFMFPLVKIFPELFLESVALAAFVVNLGFVFYLDKVAGTMNKKQWGQRTMAGAIVHLVVSIFNARWAIDGFTFSGNAVDVLSNYLMVGGLYGFMMAIAFRMAKVSQSPGDLAMVNRNKGGIDLNDLDMQTSGSVNAIQAPDPAMMNQPIKILVPQIIHIGNINALEFLGLNEDSDQNPTDHADQSAASPQLSFYRKD